MHNATGQGDGIEIYALPHLKSITPKRPKAVQIWMHKTSPRGVTRSNYAEPRGGVLGAKDASQDAADFDA